MTQPLVEKSICNDIARIRAEIKPPTPVPVGRLTKAVGLTIEAVGLQAPVGALCEVISKGESLKAEVAGFSEEKIFLMPLDKMNGVATGALVKLSQIRSEISIPANVLGRVINSDGSPIDLVGNSTATQSVSIHAAHCNPLSRALIKEPLDVGVSAVNGLLTIGRGQRLGLFAGSGVGKSELLGMMSRNTEADVVVIALIGERGREVKSFINEVLGEEGGKKSVVVVATADEAAIRRQHGALLATAIAEKYCEEGKHVLLLMDSLTRYAQAQREIGLAVGEPPVSKGYPPSVFQKIPELVERAGMKDSGGSITAFYTILVEDDETNDPVADAARAVLDGHIVLSRKTAENGIYPAVDIEKSISRLLDKLVTSEHRELVAKFRAYVSTYVSNQELIELGIYQPGSNPAVDAAIELWPKLMSYIQQQRSETVSLAESIQKLRELFDATEPEING